MKDSLIRNLKRTSRKLAAVACAVCLGTAATIVHAQNVADGFNPNADGAVNAIVVQPDGKIVLGGAFNTIGTTTRHSIARLNADGSLDAMFAATVVNGDVAALALQPDGKILLGGSFTQVGALGRNRVARLNADGSVDMGFDAGTGPDANVAAIALQKGGAIVIGGSFLNVAAHTRHCLARLSAQGALDTNFDAAITTPCIVNAIDVQPDSDIVFGGVFSNVAGIARVNLARLHPGGSVDASFSTGNQNGAIDVLRVQKDGSILIGGTFTTIGGAMRKGLARISYNGLIDISVDVQTTNVHSIVTQADGSVVVGGSFTTFAGAARANVARLNADFSLAAGWSPDASGGTAAVLALAQEPSGKIVMGGTFTTVATQTRNNIARVNTGGTLDADFAPALDSDVYSIAQSAGGKIFLGGAFTKVGATTRNYLAAFNRDGSLNSFNPNMNSFVYTLALQPDGKALAGGVFTMVGATPRHGFVRLFSGGAIDTAFTTDTNGFALAIALQADGDIIVGGQFTTIGSQSHLNLARLATDGSVDNSFNVDADAVVQALALQSDGAILIGGDFTTIGTSPRNHLARVSSAGVVDAGFDPAADGLVLGIMVQPDAKILILGNFTHLGTTARTYIARLNANGSVDASFTPNIDALTRSGVTSMALRADGKIVIGGFFTSIGGVPRGGVARLNANGTLDTSFVANANSDVDAIQIDMDGKILIGGSFDHLGGQARAHIARLSVPESAIQSLDGGFGTVDWNRSGAAPELALPPQLLFSLDDNVFGVAGTMSRTATGWHYAGYSAAVAQKYYLQARGPTAGGYLDVSSGLISSTGEFYTSDRIFDNGFD